MMIGEFEFDSIFNDSTGKSRVADTVRPLINVPSIGFIIKKMKLKYLLQVNTIVDWCDTNNLLLNVTETK